MKEQTNSIGSGKNISRLRGKIILSKSACFYLGLIAFVFFLSGCNEIKSPKPETFIAETAPPRKQEFRWSNGKMPKSFDPAMASASPETDVVRALYEGLTDLDPKTLQPVPSVASRWTHSEDYKTWIFQLRPDAKWSNGETMTAQNFVKSWKRLAELGDKVQQRSLLKNIVGMDTENVLPVFADAGKEDVKNSKTKAAPALVEDKPTDKQPASVDKANDKDTAVAANTEEKSKPVPTEPGKTEDKKVESQKTDAQNKSLAQNVMAKFGVEAIGDYQLKVSLLQPDKELPALVAHPIFRPVYGDGKEFDSLNPNTVTNGAFRISAIENSSLTFDRSPIYWNKAEVALDRVKFVTTENAESVLAAYRAGDIDAVTNAELEPLALKLLTPYDKEFRRTTHGALNFYEFNQEEEPFDDVRVRQALAIAIERERLTEGEMDGSTEPALSFSPFAEESQITQDAGKAKKLLEEAGFPDGEDFPTIRLLINRNDLQKRIARSIAKMWKKNLNIDTEIIVKDSAEFDEAVKNGEFDVVRRGVILPTTDETSNMLAMFQHEQPPMEIPAAQTTTEFDIKNQILSDKTAESILNFPLDKKSSEPKSEALVKNEPANGSNLILSREQAAEKMPAIPLYFPKSYSLVKPYVQGFDTNALDAPSLKNVQIDNNWQPSDEKNLSNGKS